eukprot:763321-Hanusia_phi.AAC.2
MFQYPLTKTVVGTVVVFVSLRAIYRVVSSLLPRSGVHKEYFSPMVKLTSSSAPFWVHEVALRHGSIFDIWLPLALKIVVVTDYKAAREILEHDLQKAIMYKAFQKVADGEPTILTKSTHGVGPRDGWKWTRKGCAGAFSSLNINRTLDKIDMHLQGLFALLDEHSRAGSTFAVDNLMLRFFVDLIADAAFKGFQMNAMTMDENSDGMKFLENVEVSLKEYTLKEPLMPFRSWMLFLPSVVRAKKASKELMNLAQRVLDFYRSQKSDDDTCLISFLNRNQYPDDRAICADIVTFMIGGHDTSAYTLSWILYELSAAQDIQSKLRQDLKLHGQESKYLGHVIQEGMRLWPVAAQGSIRTLQRDVKLEDQTIPAGEMCIMPFFAIFRSAWIDRAAEFIPERWSEEGPQKKELEEAVFPFSVGLRNCVGQRMAMTQIRKILLELILRYEFVLAKKPRPEYFLTLKPWGGSVSVRKIYK